MALAALAAVIAVAGPALVAIPIDVLRLIVGALLLIFGLQWLRKAILRAAGAKALQDELAIFAEERAAAARAPAAAGFDSYAFAIPFKAVLLEGLEVAFIVVTFGANRGELPLAATAATLAVAAVVLGGLAARAPLARVPENAMKFAVGVLLTTFGIFWSSEGARVAWPGGEVALAPLLALVLLASLAMVRDLRQRRTAAPVAA